MTAPAIETNVIELGDFFARRMAKNTAARLLAARGPMTPVPFGGFRPDHRVVHSLSKARGTVLALPPEVDLAAGWVFVRWANGAETWVEAIHLRLDPLSFPTSQRLS